MTLSISTTITGLVSKYNTNGGVAANALLTSIAANVLLGINELIEGANMTITQKAALRGDIKTICGRAMRAKLGIVGSQGEALHETVQEEPQAKPVVEHIVGDDDSA